MTVRSAFARYLHIDIRASERERGRGRAREEGRESESPCPEALERKRNCFKEKPGTAGANGPGALARPFCLREEEREGGRGRERGTQRCIFMCRRALRSLHPTGHPVAIP